MRLFRRSPRPSATPSRVRLTVEALDLRLPPSSLAGTFVDDQVPDPSSPADPTLTAPVTPVKDESDPVFVIDGEGGVPNAAPQLVNFTAVEVVGGMWRFTGDVIDEAPGGLTITFGGEPVSLQGETTTTDANGHFDVVLLMNTDGSDNGLASAQTVDAQGLESNVALTNICPG
jgi:hypothetical protein